MTNVSETLKRMREEIASAQDNEVLTAARTLAQYITEHSDKPSYADVPKRVNHYAKEIDKMIAKLDKWADEAQKIEDSMKNFYWGLNKEQDRSR